MINLSRVGFAEGWLRRGLASPRVGTKVPEIYNLCMGKSGVLGEGIVMMYRLALVAFIAFVVLGVSSVFYSHYIDVRDVEAVIMTRNVVDCVTPEGILDLGMINGEILSYCGFSDDEIGRFYVRVNVSDEKGEVVEFSQGDSGAMWVKEIFDRGKAAVGIKKYEPGYSKRVYDVIILEDNVERYGKIEVEVLVSDE